MKLPRMAYETGAVADFYEESLGALGALCSRTWYDRIEVVAEGRAAKLWTDDDALHSAELQFVPVDATGVRNADREIFPGCPLTFRLAEALRPAPLALERVVLAADNGPARPPDSAVAEKLWRNQFPDTTRWRSTTPFVPDFHFSLIALARCDIQAIDQQWTLCRLAIALPDGRLDDGLAREIGFARVDPQPNALVNWPTPDPIAWAGILRRALKQELEEELAGIRTRQENRLGRELVRVDAYFDRYAKELAARTRSSESAQQKNADRLAAAKAEHARHRADQVARHEILVYPHLDTLLLVAEPAWRATLQVDRVHRPTTTLTAGFVPRSRRWETE